MGTRALYGNHLTEGLSPKTDDGDWDVPTHAQHKVVEIEKVLCRALGIELTDNQRGHRRRTSGCAGQDVRYRWSRTTFGGSRNIASGIDAERLEALAQGLDLLGRFDALVGVDLDHEGGIFLATIDGESDGAGS